MERSTFKQTLQSAHIDNEKAFIEMFGVKQINEWKVKLSPESFLSVYRTFKNSRQANKFNPSK
jgi:hypothetical protein